MSTAATEASIPVLTAITDPVSLKVGAYYAESPYPSYDEIPKVQQAMRPSQWINALNPWAVAREKEWEAAPEILVAGCGTGQQAFRVAQSFPGARVLAVDLSRPSLAYALRKYKDSGLSNIEFAQADILALPATGRRFDVIEVGGVLHHMRDPWAGFHAIAEMLRPGGYVRPALYSKQAREPIYALRQWALQKGFDGSRDSVPRFRAALLAMPSHPVLDWIKQSPDFSTDDELRDLFFHPHEHPVSIAEIGQGLAAEGLRFLGFNFHNPKARAFFRQGEYGAENALSAWQRFEEANPLAFAGMYDFWAEKLEV